MCVREAEAVTHKTVNDVAEPQLQKNSPCSWPFLVAKGNDAFDFVSQLHYNTQRGLSSRTMCITIMPMVGPHVVIGDDKHSDTGGDVHVYTC